jgi:hypothetical protein
MTLERDEIATNSHRALGWYLSMIFSKSRFPFFRIMHYGAAASGFRCIAAGRGTG